MFSTVSPTPSEQFSDALIILRMMISGFSILIDLIEGGDWVSYEWQYGFLCLFSLRTYSIIAFDIRAFNTRDHFLVSFASGRKEARVIGIFCASFIASENASSVVCLGSKFLSRCLGLWWIYPHVPWYTLVEASTLLWWALSSKAIFSTYHRG